MDHPFLFLPKIFEWFGLGPFANAYPHVVYSWLVLGLLIAAGILAWAARVPETLLLASTPGWADPLRRADAAGNRRAVIATQAGALPGGDAALLQAAEEVGGRGSLAARVRAAEHGRSMEEEAREILRQVVTRPTPLRDLGQSIHARFAGVGGIDLPEPKRSEMRPTPDFE
jgi:hypothetical protein